MSAATAALLLVVAACDPSKSKGAAGWERIIYPSISGRVVDALTQAPIEGAVAQCLWTKTHGLPGLTYTKEHSVEETLSDKEGRIHIKGTWDPAVNPPSLTVYKEGYVAWNNLELFPSRARRKDFRWEDGLVVRMERWQEGYSFVEHEGFIAFHTTRALLGRKRDLLHEAAKWEEEHFAKELSVRAATRKGGAR